MLDLIEVAAKVADLSADRHRKAFVGAVAIRRDGVLVYSRNGLTIRPHGTYPMAHAERRVLRKSGYGSSVYVARVNRDGTLALAKPCDRCMPALRAMGVVMVYYSINPNEWGACKP